MVTACIDSDIFSSDTSDESERYRRGDDIVCVVQVQHPIERQRKHA